MGAVLVGYNSPEMVLFVAFSASAQLKRTESLQTSAKELCRPTKLLVCGVSEAEDGKMELFKQVFREVGAQKHLP